MWVVFIFCTYTESFARTPTMDVCLPLVCKHSWPRSPPCITTLYNISAGFQKDSEDMGIIEMLMCVGILLEAMVKFFAKKYIFDN